jgi:hypothetical protein
VKTAGCWKAPAVSFRAGRAANDPFAISSYVYEELTEFAKRATLTESRTSTNRRSRFTMRGGAPQKLGPGGKLNDYIGWVTLPCLCRRQ